MKVVILAGGLGTRLSELTESIPKPMLKINDKPILWHIMKAYAHFGHNEFYIALGYKAEVIKSYFLNYYTLNSNFTVNLSDGSCKSHVIESLNWKVTLVDTGIETLTGGRIKRLEDYIGSNTFLMTYGDGLSNVDINKLIAFHKNHNKIVTLTAVRPNARFGELDIRDDKVYKFAEKPQLQEGWINGGYFVIEPEIFNYLTDDTMLEREPLEQVVSSGQLMAYKHEGYWQCVDSKRDYENIQLMAKYKKIPWQIE